MTVFLVIAVFSNRIAARGAGVLKCRGVSEPWQIADMRIFESCGFFVSVEAVPVALG